MKIVFGLLVLSFVLLFRIFSGDIGDYFKSRENGQLSIYIWQAGVILGSPDSKERLGLAYWKGDGVGKDLVIAKDLLKERMDSDGDLRISAYALADIHVFNNEYEQGVFLFRKLCRDEIPVACLRSGDIYFTGEGVEKDFDLSMKYIERARDYGLIESTYFLARSLLSVDRSSLEAVGHLKTCFQLCNDHFKNKAYGLVKFYSLEANKQ